MGILSNAISDRTVSSFGVSIGTGIALESVFDPTTSRYDENREVPIKIKPTDYKVHAYNVYTLMRNIAAATQHKNKLEVYKDSYAKEALVEEVSIIKALYDGIDVEVVFYTEDYTKLYKKYNVGKDVKPTKSYEEYLVMSSTYKSLDKLPVSNKKTLVLTNYISDIVGVGSNYTMLESHTGKVKDMSTINTKYHPIGKRDMSVFPVNKLVLYLLGDKTIVRPAKISVRVALYDIAIDRHWTYRTTVDKIRHDTANDPDIVSLLNEYRK